MGYLDATKLFPGYPDNFPAHRGGELHGLKVGGLPIALRTQNNEATQDLGPISRVVMHWTAGDYQTCENAYHYVVVWDAAKKQAHVVKTLHLHQLGEHTYLFNHHSIGISMAGEDESSPLTPEHVSATAVFTAEFMCWHQLDPYKLGATPEAQLIDHATVGAFVNEGGKVDIQRVWHSFVAEVQAHHDALKAGHATFIYKDILTD